MFRSVFVILAIVGIAVTTAHVSAQRGQGLLGRPSPPQPQQKQGLEYFAGRWTFAWSGRESPLTAGARTGSVTFTVESSALHMDLKGIVDGGGPYQESGTLTYDAEQK